MVIAALLVGSTIAAPPPPAIPRIRDAGTVAVDARWKQVKEAEPSEQARLARRLHLDRTRCSDAVSLVDLLRLVDLPYRYRDTVRWRTDARPEMVALLAEAGRRLRKKLPDALVTVGDLAQQGCGQVRYGTIVRFVPRGAPQKALLERCNAYYGEQGFIEALPPEHFLDEYPRFHDEMGPVWVEHVVTGKARDGSVRLELRRFDHGEVMLDASVGRLLERTAKRLRERRHVTFDEVVHAGPDDGALRKLRRATWHDPRQRRWAEVVWRPGAPAAPLRTERLLRIREAATDPGKPTSLKFEERYLFEWDGEAGARVRRHLLEYEAHHASHLAGFDADLSYVTWKNEDHFAPLPGRLDPPGTWQWLKALDEAAGALGIPLVAMFVDRSILNVLAQARVAGRRDPLWRKLHRSPGHDTHVHLRIGPSPRWAGKSVREVARQLGLPVRP